MNNARGRSINLISGHAEGGDEGGYIILIETFVVQLFIKMLRVVHKIIIQGYLKNADVVHVFFLNGTSIF